MRLVAKVVLGASALVLAAALTACGGAPKGTAYENAARAKAVSLGHNVISVKGKANGNNLEVDVRVKVGTCNVELDMVVPGRADDINATTLPAGFQADLKLDEYQNAGKKWVDAPEAKNPTPSDVRLKLLAHKAC